MASYANRRGAIRGLAALIALSLTTLAFYLFARDPNSESEIRKLIEKAYNGQRPAAGRLSGAVYFPADSAVSAGADLGKAQILLLRQPESATRQRLQGMLYLASGDWQRFIDTLDKMPPALLPAMQNNLGVAYLGLADKDPSHLLDALGAFERASGLDPASLEPHFNLVITYRKLRFPGLADEARQRYAALDPGSAWLRELSNAAPVDESLVLDQLRRATETNNTAEARRLFESNPELSRRVAMGYALSNVDESPALVHFIAQQMERRYGDKTISAMLEPLATDKRETTAAFRDFVRKGAELYAAGDFAASAEAYAEAGNLVAQTGSVFDGLWLELNRVDTQIRIGKFEDARAALRHIAAVARTHGYSWMNAKALSIYGFTLKLTSSYGEMIELVEQANQAFLKIDAPTDRFRALYYLAAYRHLAGDQDQALKLALECLRLTEAPSRISTLDWLIGSILYRQGLTERALMFAKESVEQARNASYAGVEATTAATLAGLYVSMADYKLADQYLQVAAVAVDKLRGFEQTKGELLLGVVKARSAINQKHFPEAESVLQRNLEIYSRQPFPATAMLSQSLMLSAEVYSQTGRRSEASRKYNEAIHVIENDDEYLKTEGLRVKFDNERRELYDSAIEFEFSNGSPDSAWTYLQKYRAKLFLEFLAAFNPNIQQTRAKMDRATIQQRIPRDTQIIEYALLKDRLLIWLITDKLFTVKSVAVSRDDLEARVQTVLQKLRSRENADPLLTELGRLLIQPIAGLLDPARAVTIIPDRALHGLPFAALRLPERKGYLIQDFAVVVSPSLTHFLTANAMPPERDAITGFGSQNGSASEFRELAALKNIYPRATTLVGEQVNKASFLAAMNQAAIFHYAGHSATDAVDPLRASIWLDGNRSGPNSVTAVDISQQRLASNAVVILSSCDSSVGNSRDGVGMRGLTSAFLIGGAGSVVGSLWPVEPASTADLMIRFHRAFQNSRMPVARALRDAQLTFLQSFPEKSHPYYWSGFVVTGNFSALR